LEAGSVSGALDDLDCPVTEFGQGVTQVGAIVDAIGEEMPQPRKQLMDGTGSMTSLAPSRSWIWISAGCTAAPTRIGGRQFRL
jgi:hypothetical protein